MSVAKPKTHRERAQRTVERIAGEGLGYGTADLVAEETRPVELLDATRDLLEIIETMAARPARRAPRVVARAAAARAALALYEPEEAEDG